ncbi:MAG: hypothetical protein K9H48_14310 [Melioribacteraceae bacterium]|nr:hypothetical protein [Melioribacteraceae bacterium]MCF8395125.1 hypothetical protein [Melioribacteraceae bacterium]MCF8420534.1 hypothetical protein [Melioribacteraceae bacterium]
MRIVLRNIFIWLFFSFLLSILPLATSIIKIYSVNHPANIYLVIKDIISHGELLIITIASLGIAIGELYKEEPKWKLFQIVIGGGAFISFFIATYFFTDISSSTTPYDKNFIYDISVLLLLASVFFTISSFIIPKKNN